MDKTTSPASKAIFNRVNWLAALRAYIVTISVGNLVWEGAQLPLYTIWETGTLGEKAFAVIHCTGGDLLIALSALVVALVCVGDSDWPHRRFVHVIAATIVIGVGYTMLSEWLNIVLRKSWAYSALMPVLKVFGFDLGVSPLLQWIAVPLIAFWFARRGRPMVDS